MIAKDKCWLCEHYRPYKKDCALFFRDVDPEELRTCICFTQVKPKKKIDFEEILNSVDEGRKL